MAHGRVAALSVAALLMLPSCSGEDSGPIAGHEVQEFDEYGSGEHVDGDVEYEQNPPVAGPHHSSVLPCAAYDEIVPEEQMVHTLEHGAVGILFGPEIGEDEQTAIREYVESADGKVFSMPFPGLSSPVTVVSWTRMMEMDSFDADAVDEYVERYENDAPEPEAEC